MRLGAWQPFARATAELAYFRGATVTETTVRQRTEVAGTASAAVQTAAAERISWEAPTAPPGPARQLLSVDGTMAPLVGGQWAEVKTLVIGEVGTPVWEHGEWVVHATDLSYFSHLADAATFTSLATVETHRRGTTRAGVVCAVTDGAAWIQGFIDYHAPDAARILDFPHAAGYRGQVAAALWEGEVDQQARWLAAQCHELKHGRPAVVLERLRARAADLAVSGVSAAARATVGASLAYLEKRQAHCQYAAFRATGYPIGSGAVESAHQVVSEGRLCGPGMHWAPTHVTPMLAVRTIAVNDRWVEAWPQITAHLRHQTRERATTRRRTRQAAALPRPTSPPSSPADVAPDLPTPTLPAWRDVPAPVAELPPRTPIFCGHPSPRGACPGRSRRKAWPWCGCSSR